MALKGSIKLQALRISYKIARPVRKNMVKNILLGALHTQFSVVIHHCYGELFALKFSVFRCCLLLNCGSSFTSSISHGLFKKSTICYTCPHKNTLLLNIALLFFFQTYFERRNAN